ELLDLLEDIRQNQHIYINTQGNIARFQYKQEMVDGRDPIKDPWPGDKWDWPVSVIDQILKEDSYECIYRDCIIIRTVVGGKIKLVRCNGGECTSPQIVTQWQFEKMVNGYQLYVDGRT